MALQDVGEEPRLRENVTNQPQSTTRISIMCARCTDDWREGIELHKNVLDCSRLADKYPPIFGLPPFQQAQLDVTATSVAVPQPSEAENEVRQPQLSIEPFSNIIKNRLTLFLIDSPYTFFIWTNWSSKIL